MLTIFRERLEFLAISLALVLLFPICRVLRHVAFMKRPIRMLWRAIATIEQQPHEYWSGLFGWEMLKSHFEVLLLDLARIARPGKPAPNPALVTVDGDKQNLLDYVRGSRPLVVNLGSSPVFMARLNEFNKLVEDFSGMADFVTVYIREAHPSDGWKLDNNPDLLQAKTLEERRKAAQALLSKLHPKSTLLVDTMENYANTAFGGLYIRLSILQNGQIQYSSALGPTFYRLHEVRTWLHEVRMKSTRQRTAGE